MSDPECGERLESDRVPHLLGVKVNAPPSATFTVIFAAEAQAARLKKAETRVTKRMSLTEGEVKVSGASLQEVSYEGKIGC